jgi:hypothetical protein
MYGKWGLPGTPPAAIVTTTLVTDQGGEMRSIALLWFLTLLLPSTDSGLAQERDLSQAEVENDTMADVFSLVDYALPQPAADERIEVLDAVHGRVYSFPGHYAAPAQGVVEAQHVYPREVFSLGMADPVPEAARLETSLPIEAWTGSYWTRAAFSEDGRYLYITGSLGSNGILFSPVGDDGVLQGWRPTTPYLGWYQDGVPGMHDIQMADIGADGQLGPFHSLDASLPVEGGAFSLARCGENVLVARDQEIWASSLDDNGNLAPFELKYSDASLQHECYGQTAMACQEGTLILVDRDASHLFQLAEDGSPTPIATYANPVPFPRRNVFAYQGLYWITTTLRGAVYTFDPRK